MRARPVSFLFAALYLAGAAIAQDAIRSGPQSGVKVPQSFEAHVYNGKYADRFHCVVCENDFFPTVLIFLKDPGEGKDAAHKNLLGKLDELIEKYRPMDQYPEVAAFSVFSVFVSDAAQTSLTKPDEKDPAALVKEATLRRTLDARMREWAKPLKKVAVAAVVPESVGKFQLNSAAEMTALYYDSFNVLENFAFGEGKFQDGDIETILMKVETKLQGKIAALEKGKKKLGEKK